MRRRSCAVQPDLPSPMEAKLASDLPEGVGWQYEPKWDGFRAIVARDGDDIRILSKSGKDLGRYFPEVVDLLASLGDKCFILDGELVLPIDGTLSFDALQARLHPAPSRIARLARETPAQLILFDCLAHGDTSMMDLALNERRDVLERFHTREGAKGLQLSPATISIAKARTWLRQSGGALDGIVAKRRDQPYQPGERAMVKVKQRRSADCVVGGLRRYAETGAIVSLLLGLFDREGRLNHVGFLSTMGADLRADVDKRVAQLTGGIGFTGKAPGGPSRWRQGRDSAWEPLNPELIVEVLYDQVTGDRFRHATRFLRWRPDKAPSQCRMDQLQTAAAPAQLGAIIC